VAAHRYNGTAMQPWRHHSLRRRIVASYTALASLAAVVALYIWPSQWPAIVAMLVAGILSAWLLTHMATRIVRRRLHDLREMTEAATQVDPAQEVHIQPNGDFLKLAASVDRLASQLRDTTREQDRLQRQLTRSEKLALIGELAATVAHEINNPLDGLQNSIRIIRRDPANAAQVGQLLNLMENGLHRMEMIVRRLLTMSRDEPVHAAPTRIDEIFEEAAAFVRPRLDRGHVEVICDFPETPVTILADRGQFVQVLINLMVNAADAMPSGGTLTVCGRAVDQGRRATLTISDTGTGISETVLPRIFDPFFTTKAQGAGTGLGLAVVARIVEAHQGKIEVSSEPGHGTRFSIEMPAANETPVLGCSTMPDRVTGMPRGPEPAPVQDSN
jgi:signal transduction histidine kinase